MSAAPDRSSGTGPATREPALLRAQDLVRRYGERVALDGVSLEVRAGQALAIIGPNGAGKTTLLELLAGVQRPDGGTVERPPGGVGWVPQQLAVYRRLTVAENLRFFAELEGVPGVAATVARMLRLTGLEERAHDPVERLSGGNRQRVNVAVGLLSDPDAVLLDEPSASLDPRQRARFWEVARRLTDAGRAVVFTTHDVAEAHRHADRIAVLADGALLYDGAADALFAQARPGEDLETTVLRFLEERGH